MGMNMGTEALLPSAPLTITWSGSDGKRHKVTVPVSQLVGDPSPILYGGTVRVSIDDAKLSVTVIRARLTARNGKPWAEYSQEVIFTNQ